MVLRVLPIKIKTRGRVGYSGRFLIPWLIFWILSTLSKKSVAGASVVKIYFVPLKVRTCLSPKKVYGNSGSHSRRGMRVQGQYTQFTGALNWRLT